MKKRSIYLAAIVLALLTLTACVKYEFSEKPGGHTWATWRQNLYDLAQYRLFISERRKLIVSRLNSYLETIVRD